MKLRHAGADLMAVPSAPVSSGTLRSTRTASAFEPALLSSRLQGTDTLVQPWLAELRP